MLDDTVGERVFKFVEAAFVGVEFLTDVGLQLVGRVRNDYLVLGSADAASLARYMEGKTKGRFYYPLKPTFMSPLP